MSVETLDDPSKLKVTDEEQTQRNFVGTNLFTMTVNGLWPNNMLTTRSSGRGVRDSDILSSRVGVTSTLNGSNRVGLATYDNVSQTFTNVGSVNLNGSQTATFSVRFPYETAYGFVTNLNSSASTSGSVTFVALR